MTTSATQPIAESRIARRATWALAAALLLLVGALALRGWQLWRAPEAVAPTAPAPVAVGSEAYLLQLQEKLRSYPDSPRLYADLGGAYLQRARETGDASLYLQAEKSFDEALARDPLQESAMLGQGILANARHDFADGLAWAEKVSERNPYQAEALGVQVDALVEMGRYDEAITTLQQMMDLRPGLPSWSRTAYLRELHGDVEGAKEAMEMAAGAGVEGSEGWQWTIVQRGHLSFHEGDLAGASRWYDEALRYNDSYPFALAGQARVLAAEGQRGEAMALYEALATRLPLPEFVLALGELYEADGQSSEATIQWSLLRAMQGLNADAGMNVDMELALFNAEHGDPAQALAQARAAYDARPSIYAADALAWALFHNGQPEAAWPYAQEALRLDTRDALLHFHAGTIAHALGDSATARTHLESALTINPYFSPLRAPEAQALLASLP